MVASPAASAALVPIELIAAQDDAEIFTLPTGAHVFRRGARAAAIYGVRQGLVELVGDNGVRIAYRPGELFSYGDIAWRGGTHRSDAIARTPVEVVRLDRLRFLNLLHNHPTLAVLLIGQQHDRLREQRASGSRCY
ncbi:MAG: cyclic nucleotide-binding domain-containing protein [Synechococcaceae cyanobacterium]|nr:cyclic nucleotide-binding domain-containing protein [Synechococcaceae cyanobacterium]